MELTSIFRVFLSWQALPAYFCFILEVILVNNDYFGLIKEDKDIDYLNNFHIAFLISYFFWCASAFTGEVLIPLIFSTFILFDSKILDFTINSKQILQEVIPTWTQYFMYFSLFVTPICCKVLMNNVYSLRYLIPFTVSMFIISNLSIFSLFTTCIPQALAILTLFNKFIHIDQSKSHRHFKRPLMLVFQVFLFLLISELLCININKLINCLHKSSLINKGIKFLTRQEYSDFPVSAVNRRLSYFERFGTFFSSSDEFQIVLIVYVLLSMFCKKYKQHDENLFVMIAILSLFIPSFSDPFYSEYEINFFVFKMYMLMAFAILCKRMKEHYCIIGFIIIIVFSLYHNTLVFQGIEEYMNENEYICEFSDWIHEWSDRIYEWFD